MTTFEERVSDAQEVDLPDAETPELPSQRNEYFFLNIGAGEIEKRLEEKNAVFSGGSDCHGEFVVL